MAEMSSIHCAITATDEQVERAVRKVLAEVFPAALAGASVGIMRAIREEFGAPVEDVDVDAAVRGELEAHGDELIGIVNAAIELSAPGVESVDG